MKPKRNLRKLELKHQLQNRLATADEIGLIPNSPISTNDVQIYFVYEKGESYAR